MLSINFDFISIEAFFFNFTSLYESWSDLYQTNRRHFQLQLWRKAKLWTVDRFLLHCHIGYNKLVPEKWNDERWKIKFNGSSFFRSVLWTIFSYQISIWKKIYTLLVLTPSTMQTSIPMSSYFNYFHINNSTENNHWIAP